MVRRRYAAPMRVCPTRLFDRTRIVAGGTVRRLVQWLGLQGDRSSWHCTGGFVAARRLRPVAAAMEITTFAVLTGRLPLVTLLLALAACVTASLGPIAEMAFAFLGIV